MELIIPILGASAAFILLIFGLCLKYLWDEEEIFILTQILSTIFFFVSGACFLGVTFINPATGAVTTTEAYNWLVWLMVPLGFIPILLLYIHASGFDSNE
jgi:hypothetical protein